MKYTPIPKLTTITTQMPNSSIFEEVPSIYDKNLTFVEFLLAVLKKVNLTIETVNTILDRINSYDSDINTLYEKIDEINVTVSNIQDTIKAIQNHEAELDQAVQLLREEDINLQRQITALPSIILAEVDRKDEEIRTWAREQIQEAFTQLATDLALLRTDMQNAILTLQVEIDHLGNANFIWVYDPNLSESTTLQEFINNTYEGDRPFGMTAQEYDDLLLNASTYDGYEITAREYDFNAKRLL